MPNDITTLAIEIQSQEAERSLRSFNEIMEASSRNAGKLEKISVEVDVQAAIQQIQALKTGYDDLAASVQNIAGDINLGGIAAPAAAPPIDTTALEALKEFFVSSAEMARGLREEVGQLAEAMKQSEVETIKVSTAGSGAATVSREYAETLRELNAAQRELAKESAKADEAMRAFTDADNEAAAIARRLAQAKRDLNAVTQALNDTHNTYKGNIMGLSAKEEALKAKVAELTDAYQRAKAAAEKFNDKLFEQSEKVDDVHAKIADLEKQIEAMPAPVGKTSKGMSAFQKEARGAATQATKMARGFNAVAYSAGASIPGLSKVGQVIGTFAYAGPVIGGIVVGVGALTAAIKFLWDESQKGYKLAHEHAVQAQKDVQSAKESIASLTQEWDRLGELETTGALANGHNAEAARIIQHLTDVYGNLGLEIDKTTGALQGYARARAEANSRDREYEMYANKRAVETAEEDVLKQIEKNTGLSYEDAQEFIAKMQKSGASPEEMVQALERRRSELQDKQRGKSGDYETSWWKRALAFVGSARAGQYDLSSESVKRTEESLKNLSSVDKELELLGDGEKDGLIAAYKRLAKAKKKAGQVEASPREELEKLGEEIRNTYKLDANGNVVRRLNSAEQAAMRAQKIQALRTKIDTLMQTTAALRRDATAEDLLAWGKRFNPATGKMDGEQKQAGWRGVLSDGRGGVMTEVSVGTQINGKEVQIPLIVPESTEDDLKRIAQIANGELTEIPDDLMEKAVAFAKKRIAEGKSPFFNGDIEDERSRRVITGDAILRDLTTYQSQLVGLQNKQLAFNTSLQDEQDKLNQARRGFLYDRDGNILRKKTEAELAKARKDEIAAAEAKVAATEEGSLERYKAEMELEKLRQADFAAREKSSLKGGVIQARKQEHNSLVNAVEANSVQRLALESRNFRTPENAFTKMVEETKKMSEETKRISKTLDEMKPLLVRITDGSETMSDALATLG